MKKHNVYPCGTRIKLIKMGDDPRPIPPNTEGAIDHVDDMGHIHCIFDNGRRLGLIPEEDEYEILSPVFEIGDKVRVAYFSDCDPRNSQIGVVTGLRYVNHYPNKDYSVVVKRVEGTITYEDGFVLSVGDMYRKGSGLVTPIELIEKASDIKVPIGQWEAHNFNGYEYARCTHCNAETPVPDGQDMEDFLCSTTNCPCCGAVMSGGE